MTDADRQDLEPRQEARDFLAEVGASLAVSLELDETVATLARLAVQMLADWCIVALVSRDGKRWDLTAVHRDPGKAGLCEVLQRTPLGQQIADFAIRAITSERPLQARDGGVSRLDSIARGDDQRRALRDLAPGSLICMPLLARGELLGVLVLASSDPARRPEDLRLAEELAHRGAWALENARLYEEARRATRDLREANEHLVVATLRAQELTEQADAARARIEDSARELREAGEFRELFIGIVGHDLRTPLASIDMAAKLLLRRRHVDEEGTELVGRILRSSQRMTLMIRQLLELTRARSGGGLPIEPRASDLRDLCPSVVEQFDAAIRVEVEGDVSGTWDPDRLEEALSNITGNAVEHATPGTTVVVRAHPEGAELVVEVINEGDPIPGDQLPFIFDPFRRVGRRRRRQKGNLGLGLYIAKQIVSSHGGTLDAHSHAGTTTFVMRLPRSQPVAP